ncbi:HNH endonuclease [Arthrobacter sp. SD76]|uniref:HNH endonuclease n=1 Tax=Arthrobacter sp. SD76 TaxID=3415007 RepID=UPI003C7645C3
MEDQLPGIKISSKVRRELPSGEANGLDDYLWSKANGRCYLCERDMNIATEDIVADHVVAIEQSGETTRANLKLVHSSCNSFKKNYPTLSVTPFLRLRAFFPR